ncbi:hypothetical protein N0V84_000070 [Fusarium piperis]|uniref:Carboxypeptidase n=1 Tax=Fusarium piperis TaxID=1435070 RepID=A0A9W9BUM1_9HYPO|nr:hypothetical protein N0V84_000070 [Fusarium piperis]
MWLSSRLFQVALIGWLIIASNAQKYDPGGKYTAPGRLWGQITERHNTCRQEGLASDYSGYIPIQGTPKEQANIFFWFFEARHKPQEAPVILFLNGGPGISSIYRVFDGSGPCNFDWQGNIRPNPHSLNEYANVLYVDQPVGAGFSFGNANFTDNKKAGDYLYQFMQHFYYEFPQYGENEFGIWTSDWACTVGISLAERILNSTAGLFGRRMGLDDELPINLALMGLESPKIDPPLQLGYMYMYMSQNPWLHVQSFQDGEQALWRYMDLLEADLTACSERQKDDCKKVLKRYRKAIRSSTTPDGLRTEFDLWDVRDARHNSDRSRNLEMKRTPAARWLNDAKTQAHLGVTGGKLAREPIKFEPWNIQVLKPFSANQENPGERVSKTSYMRG